METVHALKENWKYNHNLSWECLLSVALISGCWKYRLSLRFIDLINTINEIVLNLHENHKQHRLRRRRRRGRRSAWIMAVSLIMLVTVHESVCLVVATDQHCLDHEFELTQVSSTTKNDPRPTTATTQGTTTTDSFLSFTFLQYISSSNPAHLCLLQDIPIAPFEAAPDSAEILLLETASEHQHTEQVRFTLSLQSSQTFKLGLQLHTG